MRDSKAPERTIKERRIALVGVVAAPNMWMIFDEPERYKKKDQDKTCKTYYYQNKLHAMTAYQKIIKAYKRSKKDKYLYPIKLRKLKT